MNKWVFGCQNLVSQIGDAAAVWRNAFSPAGDHSSSTAENLLGRLQALVESIENDLLVRIDSLMTAEICDDLLEQANELFNVGVALAPGVLGRAVLEEHLRKLCDRHACLPTNRPTINDFNQALYKAGHLDKIAMKNVEAMAATGNHCSHNLKPELPAAEVRKFLDDVQHFLVMNPLPCPRNQGRRELFSAQATS